ncbi:hypothetical protein [Streptomyces sp. bgisy154]|uniref:hypothetical protein n=1 Tax=Streptomyces sp. bgisy154 TaxID=3413794 RepID=UPI003D71B86E
MTTTATQLTLADCDPTWADLPTRHTRPRRPRLLDRPQMRDLHGQRITYSRKRRIADVPVAGNWL